MNKIRTFEKPKLKRAFKNSKLTVIDINSTDKEIDEFLKEKYGYGLWEFIHSLYTIVHLYGLRDLKREIKTLQEKINKYTSAKRKLNENSDQFLIDTDIWKVIKKIHPDENIKFTTNYRKKFIMKHFNLNPYFDTVNELIGSTKRRIKYLEIVGYKGIILRIKPRNLIILVWSFAMKKGEKEEDIDFKNIQILLNLFSGKKGWRNYFKKPELISEKTPELTYNKYIKYPKDKKYKDFAFCIYFLCFEDITEELKRIFPDPLEHRNFQLEAMAEIAAQEVKKVIN